MGNRGHRVEIIALALLLLLVGSMAWLRPVPPRTPALVPAPIARVTHARAASIAPAKTTTPRSPAWLPGTLLLALLAPLLALYGRSRALAAPAPAVVGTQHAASVPVASAAVGTQHAASVPVASVPVGTQHAASVLAAPAARRPARAASAVGTQHAASVLAAPVPAAAPRATAEDRAHQALAALQACGCSPRALAAGAQHVDLCCTPPLDTAQLATLQRAGWGARQPRARLRLTPPAALATTPYAPLLPLLHTGGMVPALKLLTLAGAAPLLGCYGASAEPALHALLVALLYSHSPAQLGLIVDGSAIYARAPHCLPETATAFITRLDRNLRTGHARAPTRPLLLALFDPAPALLGQVVRLAPLLRADPTHVQILVAQPQLNAFGRALIAEYPALVLGGTPRGEWQPAHGWPARGRARLSAPGIAPWTGTPLLLGADAALAAVARLPEWPDPAPPEMAIADDIPAADDTLALALAAALGNSTPRPHQDDGWPTGPADLPPRQLAALLRACRNHPAIIAAAPPGITRRRIAPLLPIAQRGAALDLVRWLDAADLLAPVATDALRLREPRMLCDLDEAVICARLHATPLPAPEPPA